MNKLLVFDMDGTVADFYSVDNWLENLQAENPRPYMIAKPLVDMEKLVKLLNQFKEKGWKIVVTSWLAKNSSKEYKELVRIAKMEWLTRYNFPADEIHLVKYGTTKANCTRKHGGYQILIDDNKKVRKGWKLGDTIDANGDIIAELNELYINL